MSEHELKDCYTRDELVKIVENFADACNWDTANGDIAGYLGDKYYDIFIGKDEEDAV